MKILAVVACASVLALPGFVRAETACLPAPMAGISSVPPFAFACPGGDAVYEVTVMSLPCPPLTDPIPLFGVAVRMDFDASGCAPFTHCSSSQDPWTFYSDPDQTVTHLTDVNGNAWFHLEMGASTGSCIQVLGESTLLGFTRLVSPDQNGDLVVDATDMAIIESRFGTTDPGADLDNNGIVNQTDRDLAGVHLGHACGVATQGNPVPTAGRAAWVALLAGLTLLGLGRFRRPGVPGTPLRERLR